MTLADLIRGSAKTESTSAHPEPTIARPDPPLPPLSRASEARRQKVLGMLARDGVRYAVLVEDPDTDPVIMTVGTSDGTREVLIPRDRFDAFEVLERVGRWDTPRQTT